MKAQAIANRQQALQLLNTNERDRGKEKEGSNKQVGYLLFAHQFIYRAALPPLDSGGRDGDPENPKTVFSGPGQRIYLQLLRSAASFIECGMVGRRCSGHNASLPVHLYLHQLRCDYTSAQAGRQTHLEMATTNLFPIAPAGLKLASFCLRLRSRKHNHVPGDQVHIRKENDAPGCAVLVKDGEVL